MLASGADQLVLYAIYEYSNYAHQSPCSTSLWLWFEHALARDSVLASVLQAASSLFWRYEAKTGISASFCGFSHTFLVCAVVLGRSHNLSGDAQ